MRNKERKNTSGLSIHPLFLLVGIFYALTGELMLFLLSTLVALQHELAHALAAARLGYRLNKVVLMPFGALIDGDLENLTAKDEICVALAGPLCNFCTAVVFLALWWLYPSTYPYTDTAFYASLSIFAVNLIPAYPLDGGRVLKNALFTRFVKKKTPQQAKEQSATICKAVTLVFALGLAVAFVVLCIKKVFQPTLLFFALFLLIGALEKGTDKRYVKIQFSKKKELLRGMVVKRVAISSAAPLKKALAFLCDGEYLVLAVYDEQERFIGELTQNQLSELIAKQNVYTPIGSLLEEK